MKGRRLLLEVALWGCVVGAFACAGAPPGSEGGALDAAMDSSATGPCVSNRDCDDQLFCNGLERCMPSAATADRRGCVSGVLPCAPGSACNEVLARCESGEAGAAEGGEAGSCDEDGDGVQGSQCGGTDCDDHDPYASPRLREQCDGLLPDGRAARDHDEDCNPCTVSGALPDGDRDSDGFVSTQCENTFAGMAPVGCDGVQTRTETTTHRVRGSDCNDAPCDSDGGVDGGAGLCGANIRPNQVQLCNGIDDNCSGLSDDVDPGATASCGSAPNATLRCTGAQCTATCVGGMLDCDHSAANGCETDPQSDVANCGGCGRACVATGGVAACSGGTCTVSCVGSTHACGTACLANNGVASCGARCVPCPEPTHGVAICDGTNCGVRCDAGYHACGSTCADDTSLASCGSSCTPCAAPPANATARCAGGACSYPCTMPFADCDSTPGCETNTATSATSCGACGNSCANVLRGSSCASGTCTCPSGQVTCASASPPTCYTAATTGARTCCTLETGCGCTVSSMTCAPGAYSCIGTTCFCTHFQRDLLCDGFETITLLDATERAHCRATATYTGPPRVGYHCD